MDEPEKTDHGTPHELADRAASVVHCNPVAAIIVTPNGQVIDYDQHGESILKSGHVLRTQERLLRCADASRQAAFNAALKKTAMSGRTTNLLLLALDEPDKRFSLTLTRMQRTLPDTAKAQAVPTVDVLCLVAPLDGRRIATAQQLIDFFDLSRAEARLARSIGHGDSVEDYARDQSLRLSTVRTQLSAVFNKTGTDRQAALVRLIAGIPVVRDEAAVESAQGTPAERKG